MKIVGMILGAVVLIAVVPMCMIANSNIGEVVDEYRADQAAANDDLWSGIKSDWSEFEAETEKNISDAALGASLIVDGLTAGLNYQPGVSDVIIARSGTVDRWGDITDPSRDRSTRYPPSTIFKAGAYANDPITEPLPPAPARVYCSTRYDRSEADVIREAQTVLGVTVDGIWGPQSQAALERHCETKR